MKSRRFLFVAFVAVLIAAALAAGRASDASSHAAGANAAGRPTVVAQSNAVWFCPGLPPALPGRSARVTFSNVGNAPADVEVTDLADKGNATHLTFQVPVNAVVTKARSQLGGPGALTVETFGGRVLVEEGIEGARALETTACATQASTKWYFAAGTTPRGVQQWLVIDNPYASDAKVDVTLRTDSGVLRPDPLQGLDLARRSRVVIPIHDTAVRKDRVAVEVDASLGSVVAAQTIVYTAVSGTPGVAMSLGAPAASTDWTFVGNTATTGAAANVAIANVGNGEAQVVVQAVSESSKQAIAPTSVTIAQDAVVSVTLGQCSTGAKACVAIPTGARYSLDVHSEQNVAIVAQTLTRFALSRDIAGAATSPGGITPARGWAFARSRAGGERSTWVSLFNPSADPSVVDVGLMHDGVVDRPPALQHVSVPPGRSVTLLVVGGRKPAPQDAALTISATLPVFASRFIVAADEVASSVGVVVG